MCMCVRWRSDGDQGTSGRTSDPLQNTLRRSCHAKATGRAPETKGRQGVHPTPCSGSQHLLRSLAATLMLLFQICYSQPEHRHLPLAQGKVEKEPGPKRTGLNLDEGRVRGPKTPRIWHPKSVPTGAPAERRRPRDARAYIRPFAVHQVPRLPRKSHRQSGGEQGTPGRTSDPLQCTKSHACHAKATGRAAESKGRQGVHPTLCSAPSPTPATQKPPAERRRARNARAYIRPLAVHQVGCLPRKSHRQSGGDQGTPGRTSDPLQCTKSHARLLHKSHGQSSGPRDGRAYIRPLAVHQAPRLPRKNHRQSGGDQGTTGRTSDPLQCTKSHARLLHKSHRQSSGDQGTPGPLQCTKPQACHAKATGRRRPRDARAYIRPLAVQSCLASRSTSIAQTNLLAACLRCGLGSSQSNGETILPVWRWQQSQKRFLASNPCSSGATWVFWFLAKI